MKAAPKLFHFTACGLAALAIATPAIALPTPPPNVLVDPGFETQTGWTLFNGAAYSQNYAQSGTWSMRDAAVNNAPGSFETFAATPGVQYDLIGYGLTPAPLIGSPAFGVLQITYFSGPNGTGNNLGTVETSPGNALTSAQINGGTKPGVWTFLRTGIATAPAGTESVAAYTLYVDFSGNNQGVYFDNLALIPVPEPSSWALLGLGLLSLPFAIRRRPKN